MKDLSRFAWGTLFFNVAVILMGAVVRATGSGAGCGRSWPTCQGEALPDLQGATAVEFAHRALSGVALVLVAVLVIWVFRRVPPPNQARRAVAVSLVAIIGEAMIGAVIVLFAWVAEDTSAARAISVPLHLLNTFLLVAALTVTAHLLSGGTPVGWSRNRRERKWLLVGAGAFLVIAGTGAVTALADTLFPKHGGPAADVEHFLTDLRIIHPIVALAVVLVAGFALVRRRIVGLPLRLITGLVGLQLLTGALTISLGVPLWMRLTHLAVADALWVAYVLAGAHLLADPSLANPPTGLVPKSRA